MAKHAEPLKPLPPQHRVILDWLCKRPARVYDFADIAESTQMKRHDVEGVIADLKHQRHGAHLALFGPDGLKLRPRHAYLPAVSTARAGYPAVEAVPLTEAEHPTLVALRASKLAAKLQAEAAEKERWAAATAKGQVHADYLARKVEARAKKVASREKEGRFRTGYSETLGPPAPAAIAAPSSVAAPAPPAPSSLALPSVLAVEDEVTPVEPMSTYKKKGSK
jgi:hypothetical protein